MGAIRVHLNTGYTEASDVITIDERLERLTERHEALTQIVELMVAENRGRERENRERDRQVSARFSEVMEGIARLLHVAELHEERIERLETERH